MSQNVQDIRPSHKVYRKYHGNWRIELTAEGKGLTEVKMQKEIFQEDALSLFVIVMMPLNHITRKCTGDTNFINRRKMYMDDIKLFGKNEKLMKILI